MTIGMAIRHKSLGLGVYFTLSFVAFVVAALITDIAARMSIASASLSYATSAYLEYPRIVRSIILFVPFALVAAICAWLEKRVNLWGCLLIFLIAIGTLCFFYANGFWDAQLALSRRRWTAASLSVGLLPFIGLGIAIATGGVAIFVAQLDRRSLDG
jgi:hypothetical protein